MTQASITSLPQRYLVLPGPKGHPSYMVWDTAAAAPVMQTERRLEAINFALTLNTKPGA